MLPGTCGQWQDFVAFTRSLRTDRNKHDAATLLRGKCECACGELRALPGV